jgi:hypothetical protein
MKIQLSIIKKPRAGYALVMVLILAAASLLVMASTLRRTSSDSSNNARNNQWVTGLYAAEAATEKVVARMRNDYLNGGDALVAANTSLYRGYAPTTTDDPYWNNFQFSNGQGVLNTTYVQVVSNRTYVPLQSQFYGLYGWSTVYRVLSNVRQTNTRYAITNAVQQDLECDSIPVFQFAIFYNSLLEFTWAAPLTVRGRTHANGNVFVGSASPLVFNSTVTSTGQILLTNWDGHTLSQYTGSITYNGNPGYSTNVPVLQLPIGTNNTPAAVREVVNMPPVGEDPNSPLASQRYFNKSEVTLLVSNTVVTAILKNSPSDSTPVTLTSTNSAAYLNTNFPFLNLATSFTDQREGKTIKATQIDLGKFAKWAVTNASMAAKFPATGGVYPNILYVADNRTNAASELTAVRIVDAAAIPTNGNTGFTLATPNPLYVQGMYNCPVAADQGTTNTSHTLPASLISDALTVLSGNWDDSQSSLSLGSGSKNKATSTTINAALLTGVVYSTGSGASQFSGGVMNLPRLLEDWGNGGSVTLTLNTSVVNFYDSVRATTQFQNPGVYYYAPTRQFSFDSNFLDSTKLPPGTPTLAVILRAKWATPPPGVATYAGN